MCKRWQESFEAFLSDMGQKPSPKHTIERIDNLLGYSPDNCKWATQAEQQRNTTRNRMLCFEGITLCLRDWAKKIGMAEKTLWHRVVKLGWSVEKAFATPVKRRIS